MEERAAPLKTTDQEAVIKKDIAAPIAAEASHGLSGSEAANGNGASHAEQPEAVSKGLYFVRIPRPPEKDDADVKGLQGELSSILGQLRDVNKRFQEKRVRAVTHLSVT